MVNLARAALRPSCLLLAATLCGCSLLGRIKDLPLPVRIEVEEAAHRASPPKPEDPPPRPPVKPPATASATVVAGGGAGRGQVQTAAAVQFDLQVLFAGCPPQLDASSVVRVGAGAGVVEGTLVLPGIGLALGAADLALEDSNGRIVSRTRTDGCGRYRFEGVAAGSYRVRFRVRAIQGVIDVRTNGGVEMAVDVGPGHPQPGRDPPPVHRVDVAPLRLAVFRGGNDHVEKILDEMGFQYQLMDRSRIGTENLSRFDIVFVNCDNSRLRSAEIERLRAFAEAGGALYLSDLELDTLQRAWPGRVMGEKYWPPAFIPMRTADADLRAYLRTSDEFLVLFDLTNMRDVEEVDPSVRVLVRDLGDAPHIVTFGAGRGIVGFTTFHHGAQLTEEMKRSLVFLISRL